MWQRSDALPAVDAGFAANAGSEGGEGAEWQMVARKKATAGTASKTVMRTGSDVINRNEGSQQTALGFEAASTAERKGEAEDLHNSLTSKPIFVSHSAPLGARYLLVRSLVKHLSHFRMFGHMKVYFIISWMVASSDCGLLPASFRKSSSVGSSLTHSPSSIASYAPTHHSTPSFGTPLSA
jgi:hypothetical protein